MVQLLEPGNGSRGAARLERLCRYAGRPAVAVERLTELPDGRLLYRLKRPWRNGTTAVVFERQDFIGKLAVLTPAPRAHLTRVPRCTRSGGSLAIPHRSKT